MRASPVGISVCFFFFFKHFSREMRISLLLCAVLLSLFFWPHHALADLESARQKTERRDSALFQQIISVRTEVLPREHREDRQGLFTKSPIFTLFI